MKAQTAEDILESQIWKDAVQGLRVSLHDTFERTPPIDAEELVNVSYKLHALGMVVLELERGLRRPSINLKNETK